MNQTRQGMAMKMENPGGNPVMRPGMQPGMGGQVEDLKLLYGYILQMNHCNAGACFNILVRIKVAKYVHTCKEVDSSCQ